MRRLFGCPDIVSLTEKFLMARNFYRIFTESNPVMGDSKTFGIPEAKGLRALGKYIDILTDFYPCSHRKVNPRKIAIQHSNLLFTVKSAQKKCI